MKLHGLIVVIVTSNEDGHVTVYGSFDTIEQAQYFAGKKREDGNRCAIEYTQSPEFYLDGLKLRK